MLFLNEKKKLLIIQKIYKVPLRTYKNVFFSCSPVDNLNFLFRILKTNFIFCSRKVSFCASTSLKGSMTLEAALILPFFMICILSILSFMEIIQLQNGMTMALRQAGMPMTVYGYAYDYAQDEVDIDFTGVMPNIVMSYGYVDNCVKEFMGDEYPQESENSFFVGNVQYYRTSIMENDDTINLVAMYDISPQFNVASVSKIKLISRFYGRAWTGYDVTQTGQDNGSEQNVYITREGSVYHITRYCTHLQLTIMSCLPDEISEMRNDSGARYSACLICGLDDNNGKYYITSDGDRYHNSLDCSGLKRTIEIIPISQVGNRRRCSRCGG